MCLLGDFTLIGLVLLICWINMRDESERIRRGGAGYEPVDRLSVCSLLLGMLSGPLAFVLAYASNFGLERPSRTLSQIVIWSCFALVLAFAVVVDLGFDDARRGRTIARAGLALAIIWPATLVVLLVLARI